MAALMPELAALLGPELKRRFAAPFELETMAAELPGLAFVTAAV